MSNPICVLVVEDEPLILLDIVDQLEDAGFRVLAAATAKEAIRILVENPDIQLMFTDVDMPGGMDGVELAAYVRNRWPPLHIIVTSGYRKVDMSEIPAHSQFFPKPYEAGKVIATIRDMVLAA